MKNKKMLKMFLPIIVIITALIIIISIFSIIKKDELSMTPELLRTQTYEDVNPGDETVYDENNEEITAIQFDAFFLIDKDGDGTGIFKVSFQNSQGFQLPVTGGMGTVAFVAGGIVFIGLGITLLAVVAKKNRK